MEEPLVKNGETILQAEKKQLVNAEETAGVGGKACKYSIVETLMMNAGETEHCSEGSGDHWRNRF